MKFIVDANVGKLAKWLRLLGYDARFFDGREDGEMISVALAEDRVILTRDTHILEWGIVRDGRVKAILVEGDAADMQVRQVIRDLKLEAVSAAFSICLECNEPLKAVSREDVKKKVPPYVFLTQDQFLECPRCGRIYWRGTHWRAMVSKVKQLTSAES